MVWDRRRVALTAVGAAVVAALAAGGIFYAMRHHPAGNLASAPKPAPVHSTAAPPGPLLSPFTGERVNRLKPVLIVKIGNTVPERPATGLARADIVYVLPVEGGLSRIMAD